MYFSAFEHGQRVQTNRLDQLHSHVRIALSVSMQECRKYSFKLQRRGCHLQHPGISAAKNLHSLAEGIGVAERFVGNCRRDLLDHVIVLNERHLKRLMNEYVRYYHDDRTHLGLAKKTPAGRKTEMSISVGAKVVSMPRLAGLHDRYDFAA